MHIMYNLAIDLQKFEKLHVLNHKPGQG